MPSCDSPAALRISNSFSQTPATAQRRNRWATRCHGPTSAGTLRHLAPLANRQRIPSIVWRSSALGFPPRIPTARIPASIRVH